MNYFNPDNANCPDWLIGDPDAVKPKRNLPVAHKQGVIQFDLTGNELARFETIKEAAFRTKTTRQSIGIAIRDSRPLFGFRWEYVKTEAEEAQAV